MESPAPAPSPSSSYIIPRGLSSDYGMVPPDSAIGGTDYTCPLCRHPIKLKTSWKKNLFFAHVSGDNDMCTHDSIARQIAKNIIFKAAEKMMAGGGKISAIHTCKMCKKQTQIPIPKPSRVLMDHLVKSTQHDVVMMNNIDEVVFIIDARVSTKTEMKNKSNSSSPWIELDAREFIQSSQDKNGDPIMPLTLAPLRAAISTESLQLEHVCLQCKPPKGTKIPSIENFTPDSTQEKDRTHRLLQDKLNRFFHEQREGGFNLIYDNCPKCNWPQFVTVPPRNYFKVACDFRQKTPNGENLWDLALLRRDDTIALGVILATNPRLDNGRRVIKDSNDIRYIMASATPFMDRASKPGLIALKHHRLNLPNPHACPNCLKITREAAEKASLVEAKHRRVALELEAKKNEAEFELKRIEAETAEKRRFSAEFDRIYSASLQAALSVQKTYANLENSDAYAEIYNQTALELIAALRNESDNLPPSFLPKINAHFGHLDELLDSYKIQRTKLKELRKAEQSAKTGHELQQELRGMTEVFIKNLENAITVQAGSLILKQIQNRIDAIEERKNEFRPMEFDRVLKSVRESLTERFTRWEAKMSATVRLDQELKTAQAIARKVEIERSEARIKLLEEIRMAWIALATATQDGKYLQSLSLNEIIAHNQFRTVARSLGHYEENFPSSVKIIIDALDKPATHYKEPELRHVLLNVFIDHPNLELEP